MISPYMNKGCLIPLFASFRITAWPATLLAFIAMLAVGCNDSSRSDVANSIPNASTDWTRDILLTSLIVDLSTMAVTADIVLAGSTDTTGASFEIGDLMIMSVMSDGTPLDYLVQGQRLDVGVPVSVDPVVLTINYAYRLHDSFDGILSNGLTFTWPYYCGNMFPCKSDPYDGLSFELELISIPLDMDVIYPTSILADAPSYMIGWAVGEFDYIDLGTTTDGTQVGVYYQPGEEIDATEGTRNLRDVMEWYEQTYGEYIFGEEVASVSVDWGTGQFGGLEHHPFWHVASGSMSDQSIHAHEAAHGWFGNGVRIACWEDFVLSEGVASYLAARSLTEVGGVILGNTIWTLYTSQLNRLQSSSENKIAWPNSCNQVDIIDDGLFGSAPYMKGAFFLRDVESVIGKEMLDQALRDFYVTNKGGYAGMQDLLDEIMAHTGYDPTLCANAWLRSESLPVNGICDY